MDESVQSIIENVVEKKETISDEEIVERMMFPMIIESARCLEEKIVDTAMEVDLGVVYGLGFPPFRGGVLKYADAYGLKKICEKTSDYAKLYGPCYQPNSTLKALAENRKNFYRV
jgi:3-hydroxyacyl-CoA dehydrogenase/enoyl-CoA hydratase/3-hydroxybutyryl-CoA epimerase/enoyl-CoA isomerase